MNLLIVIPPRHKSDFHQPLNQDHRAINHASIEQEFYDEHGSKSAQRILRLILWVELKLSGSKSRKISPGEPSAEELACVDQFRTT